MENAVTVKELWGHQVTTAEYALDDGIDDFAIFHDPGCGKSAILVTILRHLYQRYGSVEKTVIISPIVTLPNWKNEFGMFSRIHPSDILVLGAKMTGEQKWKKFVRFVRDDSANLTKNRVIILNYEAMQNKKLHEAIMKWCPKVIVLDESHRAKNHQGVRSNEIVKVADLCQHNYILTGTPILNSSMDVFMQYRIMDGGKTFGDNFWAFRNKYFVDKMAWKAGRPGYFPDWQERIEMRGEIQRKMYFHEDGRPKAHRILKEDCVDLPPLVKTRIEVEMSSGQRKMYEQMKEEFLTYVEEVKAKGRPLAVVANMAVTKALRLQQITCGFVKAEDGKEYPIVENPRLEALKELLGDLTGAGKVIVWACFKQNYIDIKRVCNELKIEFAELHGDVHDKESEMTRFRTDGNCRVMIANQKSGGIGVNLVEAPASIFYSRNFSLEEDIQAAARNYRGGSNMHEKVTRYDFIARDSIDSLIAEALDNKQSIADSILDLTNRL